VRFHHLRFMPHLNRGASSPGVVRIKVDSPRKSLRPREGNRSTKYQGHRVRGGERLSIKDLPLVPSCSGRRGDCLLTNTVPVSGQHRGTARANEDASTIQVSGPIGTVNAECPCRDPARLSGVNPGQPSSDGGVASSSSDARIAMVAPIRLTFLTRIS
jgi:hypothetical protein